MLKLSLTLSKTAWHEATYGAGVCQRLKRMAAAHVQAAGVAWLDMEPGLAVRSWVSQWMARLPQVVATHQRFRSGQVPGYLIASCLNSSQGTMAWRQRTHQPVHVKVLGPLH